MNSRPGTIRALLLFVLLATTLAAAAPAKPPHVLLLLVDDLGWMDLHCQGNLRLDTPRLDALARQGVRFTSAYSASPVCSPTRGALITGLAPARLHITQHGKDGPSFWPKDRPVQPPAAEHVLPLKTITLAERLKEAGYATGFFGKWHLSGDRDPKDPPPAVRISGRSIRASTSTSAVAASAVRPPILIPTAFLPSRRARRVNTWKTGWRMKPSPSSRRIITSPPSSVYGPTTSTTLSKLRPI